MLNGHRVSVWDDGKFWKLILVVVFQTVNILNASMYSIAHLKMVKTTNFMLYIFFSTVKNDEKTLWSRKKRNKGFSTVHWLLKLRRLI